MTEMEQLRGLVETTLHRIDDIRRMMQPKRGPMTITAFARAIGVHPRTVSRRVKNGSIRMVDHRIPASELDRFLS